MSERGVMDAPAVGENAVAPDPAAMRAIAARFAGQVVTGSVIALEGDLGAGKTEFVKGFVDGCGGDADAVSSPTFTLIHEYESPRMPVYHFDAYRVESADELLQVGLDEYLFGDGVCLIEWPQVIDHLLPAHTIRLRLEHAGDGVRRVTRQA